ncbi:hypothetical protein [Microbispora sp. NPDC049125]|uniref:hypothetical protein n=1 Tax=Microbispora sp. NPDC049125 TaxID=3154929 RepID=UPI0034662C82
MTTGSRTLAIPRSPVAVPGVVDGSLTTARDPEGNVCLYVMLGGGVQGDDCHIEFVLTPEDAVALQRTLSDQTGSATSRTPCRVGLRLSPWF